MILIRILFWPNSDHVPALGKKEQEERRKKEEICVRKLAIFLYIVKLGIFDHKKNLKSHRHSFQQLYGNNNAVV